MLKFNREKLFASHEAPWFVVDIFMLVLLMLNMACIIFDALYSTEVIRDFFVRDLPALARFYDPIHRHFIFYDLIFVTVFLVEFAIRWARAVVNGTYYRWYFYPFIHFYDLVGCIPSGGYRFLRILRIISIIYRLDRYEIIDFRSSRLGTFVSFYYEAFMEELSDRIVVKVLSGAQEEIRHGNALLHRIQTEVLLPRRDIITDWLSRKLRETSKVGYQAHTAELRKYLEQTVDGALRQNQEVQRLSQVPLLGPGLSRTLESAVGDIVAQVIHQILDDLGSGDNRAFIEDLVASVIYEAEAPSPSEENRQLIAVVNEILELVKTQMRIKRWRQSLS